MNPRATPILLLVLALSFSVIASAAFAEPAVGDKAPDFRLMGSDGKLHALSDHVGKRGVVLAWFPKAFSPG